MNTRVFALSALLAAFAPAQASVSLANLANLSYTQTFDTLGSGLPEGWSLYRGSTVVTSYGSSTGTTTTGGFYSFGSAGSTDRALGSLSSNASGGGAMVLSLLNDTGHALSGLSLSYDGEQWRTGGYNGQGSSVAQYLTLEYGFGDSYGSVSSWTDLKASFASPVYGGAAGAVNGNVQGLVADISASLALDWASGQTLWLRWVDLNDANNDHALAIDNLSISMASVSTVPEPGSSALLLAGLGAMGFVARRRAA